MALIVEELGRVAYEEALQLQERALEARLRGEMSDRLFLLEHPPVVTLGRSAHVENLKLAPQELARRGIEVHDVRRGGDVTWHGPGQLVGYLVIDLAERGAPDVGAHLRGIETALCDALRELGVRSRTLPGWTGVFADAPLPAQRGASRPEDPPRKLASIGVGVRRWVSWHGFALNVDPDLAGFDVIVPCGLHGVEMSSLARELGETAPFDLAERARKAVRIAFEARFGG